MARKTKVERTPEQVAALDRFMGAMPDPARAYVRPFDHETHCGVVVRWAEKGVGFGEISLAIDKAKSRGRAPVRAVVDAETMGADFCGRMFMALEGVNKRAEMHDVALRLLAPANPDGTLVEAVNNLRQVAASALGSVDVLEGRLRRCLQALREGVAVMERRGSAREDWAAGAERVLRECAVGVEDEGTTATDTQGESGR